MGRKVRAFTVEIGAEQELDIAQGEDCEYRITYTRNGTPADFSTLTATKLSLRDPNGLLILARPGSVFGSPTNGTLSYDFGGADTAQQAVQNNRYDTEWTDNSASPGPFTEQLSAASVFRVLEAVSENADPLTPPPVLAYSGGAISFEYAYLGTEGNDFRVTIPVGPLQTPSYTIAAGLAGRATDSAVIVRCPNAIGDRTINDFRVLLSAPLNAGDSIDFVLGAPASQAPVPTYPSPAGKPDGDVLTVQGGAAIWKLPPGGFDPTVRTAQNPASVLLPLIVVPQPAVGKTLAWWVDFMVIAQQLTGGNPTLLWTENAPSSTRQPTGCAGTFDGNALNFTAIANFQIGQLPNFGHAFAFVDGGGGLIQLQFTPPSDGFVWNYALCAVRPLIYVPN